MEPVTFGHYGTRNCKHYGTLVRLRVIYHTQAHGKYIIKIWL
jgi:hypothetical protein